MRRSRFLIGGGLVAAIAVLAGGWFLGVAPFLGAAERSDQQRAAVEQLNALQEVRLTSLEAEDVDDVRARLDAVARALPEAPGIAELLGELGALERATGARLTSLTSGDPISAEPVSADSAEESADAADVADAAPPAAGPTSGMLSIPVTLTAVGDDRAVRALLAGLQGDGRFIAMSSVSIGDDGDDGGARLEVAGAVWAFPGA